MDGKYNYSDLAIAIRRACSPSHRKRQRHSEQDCCNVNSSPAVRDLQGKKSHCMHEKSTSGVQCLGFTLAMLYFVLQGMPGICMFITSGKCLSARDALFDAREEG